MTRALWQCPRCGRTFANRNQTHTCAALGDLDRHFAGKDPSVRSTFDRIVAAVSALGPVEVLPEKTRIALHMRMSFAAFMPRRHWLDGHLVLARRLDNPRFRRVETFSPRNVVHLFRLTGPEQIDGEFTGWLAEAYRVGQQAHLGSGRQGGAAPPQQHPHHDEEHVEQAEAGEHEEQRRVGEQQTKPAERQARAAQKQRRA